MMKKRTSLLMFLFPPLRPICCWGLVAGLMLAGSAPVGELTPIILKHDSDADSVAFSPDGSWNAPEIDNDNGIIKGATALKTGGGGSSGKGVLARITFKAKKLKDTSKLTLREMNLLDPSGEYIQQYFVENGSISFPASR